MNYNFKNLADFIEAGNVLVDGDVVHEIQGGRGSTVKLHSPSHTKFWNANTDVHYTHTIVSLVPREIKVTSKQFKNLKVFVAHNTLQLNDVVEDTIGRVIKIGSSEAPLPVWRLPDELDFNRKILVIAPREETKQPVVGPTFEPYKVRITNPGYTCINYSSMFDMFPGYMFIRGKTTVTGMEGVIVAETKDPHRGHTLYVFVCEGQAYVLQHGGFEIVNGAIAVELVPLTEPEKRQGNPKYDVTIVGKYGSGSCVVDVYSVLDAFKVTIPQLQHSIKKELKVGGRGHKDMRQDLVDIRDSTQSALDAFDAKAKVEAFDGKTK